MIKKKLIYSLVIAAFILLIINILVETFSTPEVIVVKNELSCSRIDEIFITSLWDYGIVESWITAKDINNSEYDSLAHVYYIQIPQDLQIVNVIAGLSESFNKKPVKLVTEERKNHSNSTVKIFSNGVLKLEAFLDKADDLQREYAEISFIVQSPDQIDSDLKNKLEHIDIGYTLLFTPSIDLKNELEKIKKINSSFALLIDDDIDEDKYVLDTDDSKNKLARNVINIISDYGRNIPYILNEKSEIYNSVAFAYIREEFTKREIVLSKLSDYHDLRGKPIEQLKSILKFHCENGKGKQRRYLLVSITEFLNLKTEVKYYKRLGNRFSSM